MVPRFCWLDLRLAESLYSMKGLPVSTCAGRVGMRERSAGSLYSMKGVAGLRLRTCAQEKQGGIQRLRAAAACSEWDRCSGLLSCWRRPMPAPLPAGTPSRPTCASRTANHSCCALMVLRARPSRSYLQGWRHLGSGSRSTGHGARCRPVLRGGAGAAAGGLPAGVGRAGITRGHRRQAQVVCTLCRILRIGKSISTHLV